MKNKLTGGHKLNFRATSAAIIAAAMATGSAEAAIIAQYNFNSGSTASVDSEVNTTAGNYFGSYYQIPANGGNKVSVSAEGEDHGAINFGTVGFTYASDLNRDDDGLALDTYTQEFTVTIPIGFKATFDSISFDFGVREANSPSSPNLSNYAFSLRSSLTGGDFSVGGSLGDNLNPGAANVTFGVASGSPANVYSPDGSGVLTSYNYSLTDLAFDDVVGGVGGTQVTFAFALSSSLDSGLRSFLFDNVTLNGSVVAIPEPSASGILALGVAGLLMRRRRRNAPLAV